MLILILAGVAAMQSPDHLPPDCTQAANTPEINACATRDLGRETARMERYLTVARRTADNLNGANAEDGARSSQRAHLDNAQLVWSAYADIVCGAVYEKWARGSVRTAAALRCRIDMTRERTHVIWRNYLVYVDSTPPVLPEPLRPASEELQSEE
jgi:uncharacterized protein YecT (DUF1311 family)